MTYYILSLLHVLVFAFSTVSAFNPSNVCPYQRLSPKPINSQIGMTIFSTELTRSADMKHPTRRSILHDALVAAASIALASSALTIPRLAQAAEEKIPVITTDEFLIILRDSAKSIQRVEFSGPKAETVRVKLIDGTQFGLSDVVESSTDPRSPLKVQAACREAKVPFKNLELENILAKAPKKTKMYTNQRVQEAAAKEKERLERLAKDEEERLAELYKMEEEKTK